MEANMAAEASVVAELAQSLTTALYVGDLDGSVTEEELSLLFKQAGDVASVKICFDEINQRSLGYGYVNYSNPDHAEKALEILNFSRLKGKCIRIGYSNREGTQRKSGQGNIFVKNLDQTIDHKGLHDIFAPYGKIMSCKVETDLCGQSKGYGYVQFKDEEAANRAIQHLHGAKFQGKELYAVPYVSKQDRETKFTNVFVKNISASTTEEDLKSIFGEFGSMTSVAVMRDEAGNSKCFGFVNFDRAEDAAKSVQVLNGRVFSGKEWYVGRAQKKSEREMQMRLQREQIAKEVLERSLLKNNIYIKKIDDDVDDEKLKEMFSPFGTITSCKVMTDPKGISKGYGFVAFSTSEEASRAISVMNGKMIGKKPLYVGIAERKEARQKNMETLFYRLQTLKMVPEMLPPHPPPPPQIIRPNGPIFYGNVARPRIMYPHGVVPQASLLPNFMLPMIQRPGSSGQSQPPSPLMHQQMPFRGFRSYNATTSQGTSAYFPMYNTGVHQPKTLASALANASPSEQKHMLRGYLYPLVQQLEPEMASNITNMLLQMDQTEVLHLLESPESLGTKVVEVMDVLRNANPSQKFASLSLN